MYMSSAHSDTACGRSRASVPSFRRNCFLATQLLQTSMNWLMSGPSLAKRARIRVIERDTQQVHVAFAVPCCALHSEERYATSLLNVLLAGNVSSRLFQELREKRGLCYSVSSNVSQYEDTGVLNFYIGLDAKNLERALRLLCREFRRLREEPVRPAELKRAKEYAIGSSRMSLERTGSQNSRIGYSTVFYGEVADAEIVHARLRAVTPGEIQRVARVAVLEALAILGPRWLPRPGRTVRACVITMRARVLWRGLKQVFRQSVEFPGRVDQVRGDHVDHPVFVFHPSANLDQPRTHHDLAIALHRVRPDDEIGDAGFVFDGDEDHALGRTGALADQYDTGEAHRRALLAVLEIGGAQQAACAQRSAQEAHRMGLQA